MRSKGKKRTTSQKAELWGPVLPTVSPPSSSAVLSLCGFSGRNRNAIIEPVDRARYRLPGSGIIITFSQFILISMNFYCHHAYHTTESLT